MTPATWLASGRPLGRWSVIEIATFKRGDLPFIIRHEEPNYRELVGEAYVLTLM